MSTSSLWIAPHVALRLLWGIAAIGLLLERMPWTQPSPLAAADGYLGFLALGLWAATGGTSRWSRRALIVVVAAWLSVMAYRLSGFAA
jgi:hypothetical protein